MGKRMYRSRYYLDYYKKFYCHICKEYSIRMHLDEVFECENNCDMDSSNIDLSDFSGFYDREDIEKKFYTNEVELLDQFFGLVQGLNIDFKTLSKKEAQRVNELFIKKNSTEIKVDDIVARYLKINNKLNLPEEMDNFGYVLNLIEDIHYFLIRACQDIVLYDIALEYNKKENTIPFHTARFFFYNSVESVWYSYERIIVFLGIKYGFKFEDNFENNTTVKIIEYLKKNKSSRVSETYIILNEYINKNRQFINDIRTNNTHGTSKHILDINKQIKRDPKNAYRLVFEHDANYYDEKNFKPQISKLISAIENLYKVLLNIIKDFTNSFDKIENVKIPMLEEFRQPIDNTLFIKTDKIFDLKRIDQLKSILFETLVSINPSLSKKESLQLMWDIFFRLEDVQKCIVDAYNLQEGYLIPEWNRYIAIGIERFLDEKTLLYAGLSRIYAILDKFSKYIAFTYNKKSVKYFKDISELDKTTESNTLKQAIELARSNEYKLMYILRNRIAHNLSTGALMGSQGIRNDNYYIFYCINYLIFYCFDLMLIEVNENIKSS